MNFGYIEDEKLHFPIYHAEFEVASGKAVYDPEGLTNIAAYAARLQDHAVQVSLDPPTRE